MTILNIISSGINTSVIDMGLSGEKWAEVRRVVAGDIGSVSGPYTPTLDSTSHSTRVLSKRDVTPKNNSLNGHQHEDS